MGFYRFGFSCLLNFILIIFSFFSASAYAITDAEIAAIRQQRAQAEYAAAVRAQIERYDQSVEYKANRNALANQINGTVSAAETISDGSKVSSVSTISKAADAAKAAGTVASRYGKAALRGAPASFLGYAAFEGLMKGVGYLIDDGSKVVMKPVVHGGSYSIHGTANKGASWDEAGEVFCYNWKNYFGSSSDCKYFGVSKKVSSNDVQDQYEINVCYTNSGSCKDVTGANNAQRTDGYFFKENSTTTNEKLTNEEIQQAIQKYLEENPNSNITNNIYLDAYSPDKTFSLSDESVNGLSSEIAKQVSDNLASAAQSPTGRSSTTLADGTQVDTSIDTSGKTGTGSSTSTTTNPDGTTTTTTATSSSELPAFCSWASIVCDWIAWTKEEPTEPTSTKPDFVDFENPEEKQYIRWEQRCPAPVSENVEILGTSWTYEFKYDSICEAAQKSSWWFVFAAAIGAVFIIAGVRNG